MLRVLRKRKSSTSIRSYMTSNLGLLTFKFWSCWVKTRSFTFWVKSIDRRGSTSTWGGSSWQHKLNVALSQNVDAGTIANGLSRALSTHTFVQPNLFCRYRRGFIIRTLIARIQYNPATTSHPAYRVTCVVISMLWTMKDSKTARCLHWHRARMWEYKILQQLQQCLRLQVNECHQALTTCLWVGLRGTFGLRGIFDLAVLEQLIRTASTLCMFLDAGATNRARRLHTSEWTNISAKRNSLRIKAYSPGVFILL